jgi:hypothetical protein
MEDYGKIHRNKTITRNARCWIEQNSPLTYTKIMNFITDNMHSENVTPQYLRHRHGLTEESSNIADIFINICIEFPDLATAIENACFSTFGQAQLSVPSLRSVPIRPAQKSVMRMQPGSRSKSGLTQHKWMTPETLFESPDDVVKRRELAHGIAETESIRLENERLEHEVRLEHERATAEAARLANERATAEAARLANERATAEAVRLANERLANETPEAKRMRLADIEYRRRNSLNSAERAAEDRAAQKIKDIARAKHKGGYRSRKYRTRRSRRSRRSKRSRKH